MTSIFTDDGVEYCKACFSATTGWVTLDDLDGDTLTDEVKRLSQIPVFPDIRLAVALYTLADTEQALADEISGAPCLSNYGEHCSNPDAGCGDACPHTEAEIDDTIGGGLCSIHYHSEAGQRASKVIDAARLPVYPNYPKSYTVTS